MKMYDEVKHKKEGIESPAFVHPSAKIGKSVFIGAFCYIDEDVVIDDHVKLYAHTQIGKGSRIGTNTSIFSGVKVYHNTQIGANCIIHAGVVIGSDGFGFAPNKENEYQKVPQIGNVIIQDHVEIGANTTIDRATIGSTIIKKGVKLDNLVQIAHNVEIGENSVVAAQTGIAGSTKIGSDVMIGGQVGIVGHITIAKGTKIAAQSGVGHSIVEENSIIQGSPAFPIGEYKRSYVLFKNLPNLRKQIIELSAKINKQEKIMTKQKTIAKKIHFSGFGLHTGKAVNMVLEPAPENHGIKFQRTDIDSMPIVPANIDFVTETQRSTTLESKKVRIITVEHILSALYALTINNVLIKIDQEEVPILDGSAKFFVKELNNSDSLSRMLK